jgi:AAA domain
MKLIGLSGAQGAGKSTLLKTLMERGWLLDSFRVSRAVQAQFGWTSLESVMESPQAMMKFQEAVFEQKLLNDYRLHELPGARTLAAKGHVMLTERTFADIDAYTTQWTWRFVDKDEMSVAEAFGFLTPFHKRCLDAQLQCYEGTIMLPFMQHVAWEDDSHRAAKNDVTAIYEHIERYMDSPMLLRHPKLIITTKSVDDRVVQTEKFLEGI